MYSEAYRQWDSAALASYLSLPTAERHGCRYVSFEDEAGILAKGQYSIANGYGGTIIWTINQSYVSGHTQPNFLLQAMQKAFVNPAMVQTPAISVMQRNVQVKASSQYRFSALVTGTTDKAVTWSVNAGCGSIGSTGLFVAPASAQTCQITATHNADGLTASSTVTVVP